MPHWVGPDASTQRPAIGSGGAPGRTMVVPVVACSPAQPASVKPNAIRRIERIVYSLAIPARGSRSAGIARSASLHGWNDELCTFLRSGGPARRDGLGLG